MPKKSKQGVNSLTRVLLMSTHAGADGQHFSSRNQRSQRMQSTSSSR